MPKNKVAPCPGHEGTCVFCKQKGVPFRYIDSVTKSPVTSHCCKACEQNDNYAQTNRSVNEEPTRPSTKW